MREILGELGGICHQKTNLSRYQVTNFRLGRAGGIGRPIWAGAHGGRLGQSFARPAESRGASHDCATDRQPPRFRVLTGRSMAKAVNVWIGVSRRITARNIPVRAIIDPADRSRPHEGLYRSSQPPRSPHRRCRSAGVLLTDGDGRIFGAERINRLCRSHSAAHARATVYACWGSAPICRGARNIRYAD